MRKKFKKRLVKYKPQKKQKVQKKALKRIIKVAAICSVVIIVLAVIDAQIGPIVTTIAEYQCQNVSIIAINEAVIDEMSKSPEMIESLVDLQKNNNGAVTSITVNTSALNDVKARLTTAVSERLQLLEYQNISIPLGTLFGWKLLSGRGPDVNLQLIPASFVTSTTHNKVTTAGINQTQHSIEVHFTVEMSVVMPGYSTETIVENDVTISETIIVGEVPMFYSVAE